MNKLVKIAEDFSSNHLLNHSGSFDLSLRLAAKEEATKGTYLIKDFVRKRRNR